MIPSLAKALSFNIPIHVSTDLHSDLSTGLSRKDSALMLIFNLHAVYHTPIALICDLNLSKMVSAFAVEHWVKARHVDCKRLYSSDHAACLED